MILVTVIAAINIAGRLWYAFSNPNQFENAFLQTHTAFNLYKNVLLPDVSVVLFSWFAYTWFSLFTIPRLMTSKQVETGMSKITVSFTKTPFQSLTEKTLQDYAWLIFEVFLAIFILGVVYNTATYYRHQWQFNYKEFSIFFNKNIPQSQLDVGGTFFAAASVVGLFTVYVFLREVIISKIESSTQKEFKIAVSNKVTIFLLAFLTISVFLQSFNLVNEHQFFPPYVLFVSAVLAMFINNVYWLFPLKGNASFFSSRIMLRLLSTSFIYAIPLINFVHEQGVIAFLYCWAFQLFIVTPLTWWYYQFNKEKILQLRVIETALVKSETDIQFLRSQINPHFLFNSLNTLYGTALQEDAGRTAEGIQRLGDMMRFMLHENSHDFIDVSKEVEYLKNYIALQKLRTQSSPVIHIEENISEQICHHKIAPMLLIPIVENAFKHGISLTATSWIKIDFSCTEKNILFEVRNSMHEKKLPDAEKERPGIGFKNVLERLKLIYPGKFHLITKGDGKEYLVKLSVEPV